MLYSVTLQGSPGLQYDVSLSSGGIVQCDVVRLAGPTGTMHVKM